MFTIDDRLRGLPARKDQVVSLYQSLNAPHLAVPNRQAGAAKGYVLGLRGASGYAVFVYIHLPASKEAAVYVPESRSLPLDEYEAELATALNFVESMGFMMDDLRFTSVAEEEQTKMLTQLPIFQRDPGGIKGSAHAPLGQEAQQSVSALGRMLSSFCLLLLLIFTANCRTVSAKDAEAALIHHDLGVNAQNPQQALAEYDKALELDPYLPEAHRAKGFILHIVFKKYEEAQKHFLKAIALRPDYSEAKVNLATLLADQSKFAESVKVFEEVLNDVRYPFPYLAHGNLGWTKYLMGDSQGAITELQTSVLLKPEFCWGYMKMGVVYSAQGNVKESCRQFRNYRDKCPEVADAYAQEGACLAQLGQVEAAKKAFDICEQKANNVLIRDDCRRSKEKL